MIPESIAIPTGLTGLANHQPVHASSFITCTIVLYLHLLRLVSTDELRVFGFLRQLQDTSIPLASYSFSFFLCPHRVMRVVDHSKNARTPCLKYANFTQNTQNLRKLRKFKQKVFAFVHQNFEWSTPRSDASDPHRIFLRSFSPVYPAKTWNRNGLQSHPFIPVTSAQLFRPLKLLFIIPVFPS